MRLTILLIFATQVLTRGIIAQKEPAFPPGALEMEARLLTRIGPQTRAWIKQEAARENGSHTISQTTATRAVTANQSLRSLGATDIEALAILVMMEGLRLEQEITKAMMDDLKQINSAKASLRKSANRSQSAAANARAKVKHDLDSLSETGEMQSLRLQMAMDRQSKFISTLSNMLKKMSETSSGITQNLK
jgi:hypothetical protein